MFNVSSAFITRVVELVWTTE